MSKTKPETPRTFTAGPEPASLYVGGDPATVHRFNEHPPLLAAWEAKCAEVERLATIVARHIEGAKRYCEQLETAELRVAELEAEVERLELEACEGRRCLMQDADRIETAEQRVAELEAKLHRAEKLIERGNRAMTSKTDEAIKAWQAQPKEDRDHYTEGIRIDAIASAPWPKDAALQIAAADALEALAKAEPAGEEAVLAVLRHALEQNCEGNDGQGYCCCTHCKGLDQLLDALPEDVRRAVEASRETRKESG